MAGSTTNISLIKPEITDATVVRTIYNTNLDTIDGRFSATYLAVQAKASVSITGGSITGITDLAIADGGTGSSTAGNARTALGLAIGTNVEAHDDGLLSIAGLTTAANKMIYTTASDTYAVASLTAFARTILDDADASAVRTTIGAQSTLTNEAGLYGALSDVSDFVQGAEVNSIDSGMYVDASIDHEHLAPDVISGMADVTSVDADYILIWDATDSALKKCDMAEVRNAGGGFVDISGTPVDNDFAKFTDPNTIEGRSYLQTRNDLQNYVVYPQDYGAGAGTVGDPWDTECCELAYAACPTGGTIFMRAGYYELTGSWGISKAINIIGEGMGKTIIVTDNAIGFYIEANHVTLKGFTINAGAQTNGGGGCGIAHEGDYAIMEDIEIKDAGTYGLDVSNSDYGLYRNFFIHGCYNCNVHINATTTGKGKYNSYRNFYVWDSEVNVGFGDDGNDSFTEQTGNIYDNIVAWDNTGSGIGIGYQRGITATNLYSTGNGGWGIYLVGLEESSITNAMATLNGITDSTWGVNADTCKKLNLTNIIATNNYTGIGLDDCSDIVLTSCQSYDTRKVSGIDIAFVDGGAGEDTITMTAAEFLEVGLFEAGETITVSGAGQAGNNGTHTIVSVVAGTINVATASLTTETAGASVTITQYKQTYGLELTGTNTDIGLLNCKLSPNATGRISIPTATTTELMGTDLHTLDQDHDFNGLYEIEKVGESVVFGELLYFNWTDKEWKKTDADAAATMPGLRIALDSKADGQDCLMLVQGDIRDDSAFAFAGSMVYASCTPGDITSTAPSASGDQIQRVGQAKSADILFFSPSNDVGEI